MIALFVTLHHRWYKLSQDFENLPVSVSLLQAVFFRAEPLLVKRRDLDGFLLNDRRGKGEWM